MFPMTKLLIAALLLGTIAITGATLALGTANAETLAPQETRSVTPAHSWADSVTPRHAIGPAGNFDPFGTRITGTPGSLGAEEVGVRVTDAPVTREPGLFFRLTSLGA